MVATRWHTDTKDGKAKKKNQKKNGCQHDKEVRAVSSFINVSQA